MSDELVWNLSDIGQHNIIQSLERKIDLASYHFECDCCKRTIINVDDYENMVLSNALHDYKEKIEKRINEGK